MLLLPRSTPLQEQLPVSRINLPDALRKMASGGFTGYLGYGSSNAEAYLVFIKGALISILLLEQNRRANGFEALNGLFRHAADGTGVINLYRMTTDVAICTHALLHGTTLTPPHKVANLDLKALIARMYTEQLTGTMLFTTPERSAMAFYKQGTPIGFYHDAARDVETSPLETQRIAALPEATVAVHTVSDLDTLLHHSFLETLNIERLWQTVQSQTRQPSPTIAAVPTTPPAQSTNSRHDTQQLAEITDDLQEIVKAYLGRAGSTLVSTLLDAGGGPEALQEPAAFESMLKTLATQGAELDPEAKLDEMIDLIRSEVAGRLAL